MEQNQEPQKPPRKRRAPRAWIYENGEKKPFVYEKSTDKKSAMTLWWENHPEVIEFTKEELRYILK